MRKRRATGLARTSLLSLALSLALAAPAAAAPFWLDPTDLSNPGRDAGNPAVAMDAAGDTVALWEQQNSGFPSVAPDAAVRVPGGVFGAPVPLAPTGSEPHLAITPAGEAVAVWKRLDSSLGVYVIEVATRQPGGTFSPPVDVYAAPPSLIPQGIQVAIGDRGDVAVTWMTVDPDAEFSKLVCAIELVEFEGEIFEQNIPCKNPSFVMASVRPAGGVFSGPKRISPPRGPAATEEEEIAESKMSASEGQPVVDGAGDVTVVWAYFDGEDRVVQSSVRPAGGAFGEPTQVSQSGANVGSLDVGGDAAGNAIATWTRDDGADKVVQAGLKPPGGSFSVLPSISPPGTVQGPAIGVAPSGTATIVWRSVGISQTFLEASTRPPGGSFSSPVKLNSGKDEPLFHDVAVGDRGAVVAWSGDNGPDSIVRAAVDSGGGFGSPVAISESIGGLFHPKPSVDAGGNATVVWVRDNGVHDIVQFAGYDADPPRLSGVSIPPAAVVGESVDVSATSTDEWPVGLPVVDFGDFGQGVGTTVPHAYSAPGTYKVTVSASDSFARTATHTGSVLVKARNYFSFGKLRRNLRKGTATLRLTIPEPGTIVASGKGIKKRRARSDSGGSVKVLLKPQGKALRQLRRNGRVKVRLRVAYSPVGGETNVRHRRLSLRVKSGQRKRRSGRHRRA